MSFALIQSFSWVCCMKNFMKRIGKRKFEGFLWDYIGIIQFWTMFMQSDVKSFRIEWLRAVFCAVAKWVRSNLFKKTKALWWENRRRGSVLTDKFKQRCLVWNFETFRNFEIPYKTALFEFDGRDWPTKIGIILWNAKNRWCCYLVDFSDQNFRFEPFGKFEAGQIRKIRNWWSSTWFGFQSRSDTNTRFYWILLNLQS